MAALTFFVPGTPVAQGSKRYLGPRKMVESSEKLPAWRADVRAAAERMLTEAHRLLWDKPLTVDIVLSFQRPKGHYGTGRNAGKLKDSAPLFHAQNPDADKCARAIFDALTGLVYADDRQICDLHIEKTWADHPGADISVEAFL